MKQLNVGFERAKVGDRYVFEKLQANGWQLGGESSGHLLVLDRHSTGDGIVSALQVLRAVRNLLHAFGRYFKASGHAATGA